LNAFEVVSVDSRTRGEERAFHTGHHSSHPGRTAYNALLAQSIASMTTGPVLDVGCGVGHLLSALADRGVETVGFDVSEEALAIARADHRLVAVRHDANEPWPFPDGSFAAVTMIDVLEHFIAYDAVLEDCRRVLRPGGSLFIVTVNYQSVLRLLLRRKWGGLKDPEHVRYYTKQTLREGLEDHGFRTSESRTFFNFSTAGESSLFLRPLRIPGFLVFVPAFGDSVYVRAERRQ
jgi:2-polyprenyl-3-methyl-5-hydroxy-6-metoxy-1,4-benzoquinol methylase